MANPTLIDFAHASNSVDMLKNLLKSHDGKLNAYDFYDLAIHGGDIYSLMGGHGKSLKYMFDNCKFIGCAITDTSIRQIAFRNCTFENSNLSGTSFSNCAFASDMYFTQVNLNRAYFMNSPIRSKDLIFAGPDAQNHSVFAWKINNHAYYNIGPKTFTGIRDLTIDEYAECLSLTYYSECLWRVKLLEDLVGIYWPGVSSL